MLRAGQTPANLIEKLMAQFCSQTTNSSDRLIILKSQGLTLQGVTFVQ